MGRKFSSIDEWETYVPNVDGEQALYADDPDAAFTVELRFLTARELKEYEKILRVQHASQIDAAAREYAKKLFCDNVRNVRNYAPRGEDLTTGEQLWEHGEPQVINDISKAMQDRSRLEAGLAKKLSSPSVSSSSPAPTSDGGNAHGVTVASTPPTRET